MILKVIKNFDTLSERKVMQDLLTKDEIASIFAVSSYTIDLLVKEGAIPHRFIQTDDVPILRFNPQGLASWLQAGPVLDAMKRETYLERLKQRFEKRYPEALRALQEFDSHISPPRQSKYYTFVKVPSKKFGFLYYVRYLDKGKLVRSKWNTHTNDLAEAERFAAENRERILAEYYRKREEREKTVNLYAVLAEYYKEDSPYLAIDRSRNRLIDKKHARIAHRFIIETFISFLKAHKVKTYQDIEPPLLVKLQNELLQSGKKAQTVNFYLQYVKAVFSHLVLKGDIGENVFSRVAPVKVRLADRATHGCYDVELLKGVFGKPWEDKISYLLCLMIYTTNLRNSELERVRLQDI
jgi:hypothetical protein